MNNELKVLGFTDTESTIYLYLVQSGRRSPALISRDTGIKRPTVYAALAEMVRRRVISEDVSGTTKSYYAKPGDLANIVTEEKKRILEEESALALLAPQLLQLAQNQDTPMPRIEYIREHDLEDFLYRHNPLWNESMIEIGETSWWGYNSSNLTNSEVYRKWIEWSWKTSPTKIELHLFSVLNEGERKLDATQYPRRYIKYWEEETPSSQWILGDYIVFSVTDKHPHYAIQIHDKMMADAARRVFRRLWNLH